MGGRILVVDDDPTMCEVVADCLVRAGHEVTWRSRPQEALDLLQADPSFEVVLTDLAMPGLDGADLCRRVAASRPLLPVIVLTAHGRLDAAVGAMRAGAYDFLTKPIDPDALQLSVERALERRRLSDEVRRLRRAVEIADRYDELLGESPPMRRLYQALEQVASSALPVLVQGETGTGKELVARALHRRGPRADGPFVAFNCAAIPESLLESELFGHTRGTFTGAEASREGLLLQAHRGTLLLDEVGDMPAPAQVKLLRALQERKVRPVGSATERPFDARIIAATNKDLEAAVEEGRFRQDLYFRLNVLPIEVPPLRARGRDVLLLAQRFLARAAERAGKPVAGLLPAVAERLLSYDWPGNVRELESCIERAVAVAEHEQLVVADLPPRIRAHSPAEVSFSTREPDALVPLAEVERRYVLEVLRAVDGHRTRAARILGLDRKTLYRMLERWRADAPDRG